MLWSLVLPILPLLMDSHFLGKLSHDRLHGWVLESMHTKALDMVVDGSVSSE